MNTARAGKLKAAFFWILLVSSDTVAQLLLKLGAMKGVQTGSHVNRYIIIGYSFYAISFVAWMQILKHTRLSIALAAASVLYITVAVASHFLMGEEMTLHLIIGTILIATGVFILGWSEGKKEGPH